MSYFYECIENGYDSDTENIFLCPGCVCHYCELMMRYYYLNDFEHEDFEMEDNSYIDTDIESQDTDNDISYSELESDIERNRFLNTVDELKIVLSDDLISCDLTWSLFHSALHSYRYDTCLRPYPPMFLDKEDTKNIVSLRRISATIPDMQELLNSIRMNPDLCDTNMVELLHWVLVKHGEPVLKPCWDKHSKPDLSVILKHISSKQMTVRPSFIFKVLYSETRESKWQARKIQKPESIFAFHGSRLDNFYSILKSGLQHNINNRETLFGAGVYLSSELNISLTYSPSGKTWEKSMCNSDYSIVALCELINDSTKVKCQDTLNEDRAVNEGSVGGKIPEKYYVVLDNDYVCVRYLLIYTNLNNRIKKISSKRNIFYNWAVNNKMMFMLMLYVSMLVVVNLSKGSIWNKLFSKFSRLFKN